jgi:hypothetical protein
MRWAMGRWQGALVGLVALAATATAHAEEPPRIVVVTGDGATMQTVSSRNPRPERGIVAADSPTTANPAAAPGLAPAPISAAPTPAPESTERRLQEVRPAAGGEAADGGHPAGARVGLLALSVGGALGAGIGIGQMLARVRAPARRSVPGRRPPPAPYRYAVVDPRPKRTGEDRAARPPRPALTAPRTVKLR